MNSYEKKRENTVPRNIYHIFNRESIDTETLHQISQILEFDFFRLYFSKKITEPLIKNEAVFNKQPSKKILITIEVDEEKQKDDICKILNIPN